nr:type I-E CRISPR-associated protein Cas5/CasD [Agathobaculum sp. Marseille-P7918]
MSARAKRALILALQRGGVLQSWGESSKWDTRDSAVLPTKSGVIGLLACALGWARGDERIADMYDALQMTVRADRQVNRMVDYHTVTGNPLRNAEGKPRSTGNTIISRREYRQDASFLVIVAA